MSLLEPTQTPRYGWLEWRPVDVIAFLALAAAGILTAWPILRGMTLGWWAPFVIVATALSFSFVMVASLRALRWLAARVWRGHAQAARQTQSPPQ
jgi:hypothetical protein